LSFKAGIPSDSGTMEDRDWRDTKSDRLTDFSSHTNRTLQFFSLNAAIGVSLPVGSYFFAKPFISGRWMRFSFTGRNGYGKYYEWKNGLVLYDKPYEVKFRDDVISYKQDWLLFSPGISVGAKIHPFAFDLSVQVSLFSYCASRDDHLKAEVIFSNGNTDFTYERTFLDYTRMGLFMEPAFNLSFTLRRIEFFLGISGLYMGSTRGESYMKVGNGGFSQEGEAGAGISLLDTRFLIKIHL